jgi:putative NIF3 family GTP cyclohydrolase 1 type 2
MRVLLDQGTPVPLKRYLPHHTVRTAFQEGWATRANGDLLTAADAAGFDVFVTTDKNLRYQQDLSKRRIAVVVLGHGQWPGLEPHASLVVAAIDRATPGGYEEVTIPVE